MIGQWVGDHDLYAMLADIAVRRSDIEALKKYTPLAVITAERYQHPLYGGIASRARGVLSMLANEHDQAVAYLNQSLKIFRELDTHWQMGRTLANLGDLEFRRNDRLQAKEYYRQAASEFIRMQAAPDLIRVQEALSLAEESK